MCSNKDCARCEDLDYTPAENPNDRFEEEPGPSPDDLESSPFTEATVTQVATELVLVAFLPGSVGPTVFDISTPEKEHEAFRIAFQIISESDGFEETFEGLPPAVKEIVDLAFVVEAPETVHDAMYALTYVYPFYVASV